MSAWTAPSTGTFHFQPAPDRPPHRFEDCTDDCRRPGRAGWFGWCAEGAEVDPDDDPNMDPAVNPGL